MGVLRPEEAIYAILTSNTNLNAQIGLRCYPGLAPESATFPYIVYERISSDHWHDMGGSSGMCVASFQIDVVAETYSNAKAVSELVRLAIDGYRGTKTVGTNSCVIRYILIDREMDGYVNPTQGKDVGWYRSTNIVDMCFQESEPTF